MGYIEELEQRFGCREKLYHKTGEANEENYLSRLTVEEKECLYKILGSLQTAATAVGTSFNLLAVGSSADLNSEYRDIDLLVVGENPSARFEFANEFYKSIATDNDLITSIDSPKGSAPLSHPHYLSRKAFCILKPKHEGGHHF